MIAKGTWNKIEGGLNSGIYKMVRLVRILSDGTQQVIVPYNKESEPAKAPEKLKFIKHKIQDLPVGTYEVQARVSFVKGSFEDKFRFTIDPHRPIPIGEGNNDDDQEPIATQQIMNGSEIDLDDYIKVIKENAQLSARVDMLEVERDHWKNLYRSGGSEKKTLSDAPPEKSVAELAFATLSEALPGLIGLGDKFMSQRDKSLEIEEKRLSMGEAPPQQQNGKKVAIKKPQQHTMQSIADMYDKMLDEDPVRANLELDKIQEENPKLYEYLCEELDLDGDDEEEEEEDPEGEGEDDE